MELTVKAEPGDLVLVFRPARSGKSLGVRLRHLLKVAGRSVVDFKAVQVLEVPAAPQPQGVVTPAGNPGGGQCR